MRILKLLNRLFHGPSWLKFRAMGVGGRPCALLFQFASSFSGKPQPDCDPMARWPRSMAESSSFSN
jgi:hypothetical protein